MRTGQVSVIAYLTVQPGTEQGVLSRFAELVANTRIEPGCINYDFHQHPTEAHRFVFYENYVDQRAFEDHIARPHTRTWVDYIHAHGGRFDVESWTMLSQPTSNTTR
ncbi:MAG: antibiotic biosynthesis monooxygenase [Chloroflexota bacterium]|nr:antibiotic biosynthesis monooxygenase [Chloroflexota bacterium]